MKKVNIITSLSPQKQYEIYRWFWITLLVSICLGAIGAYFIGIKIFHYSVLKKEIIVMQKKTSDYANALNSSNSLKKEYDELRLKENKLNAYKSHKKNPYNHIAEIVYLCKNGIKLESIRCEKEDIEIVIISLFADHIQSVLKQLSTSQNFSRIKMVSLQQNDQDFDYIKISSDAKELRCTIQGKIIFS